MDLKQLKELGFFEESSSESSGYIYTREPTNDLDFLRLLDGKEDFYRLPAQLTVLKKKHIVISDLFLLHKVLYFLKPIHDLFSDLFQQGFTISVWTLNGLLAVKNLHTLNSAWKEIVPIHQDDLLKYLAGQGLASKDLYLLGTGKSSELIERLSGFRDIIDTKAILALPDKDLEILFACMSNTSPIALKLFIDEIHKTQFFLRCLKQNPAFYFTFSDMSGESLQSVPPIAKYCKKISLVSIIDWQGLSEILQSASSLESLSLIHGSNLQELPIDYYWPPMLKNIDFSHSNISWQQLSQLIKSCPLIENLYLRYTNLGDLKNAFLLPATLKILSLGGTDISWQQLLQLLSSCPLIEKLDLSSCNRLGAIDENVFVLPRSLKKIDLSFTDISWQQLSQALKSCPFIEELDLGYCDCLGAIEENVFVLPRSLKKVTLRGEKVSWQQLSQVCKSCPTIESLTLTGCSNLGYLKQDDSLLLTSLKKIDLESSNISWQQLQQLFKFCPTIEELSTEHCSNLGTLEALAPTLLSSTLKKITLSSTDINGQALSQLFTLCPSIEELVLYNYPNLTNLAAPSILPQGLKKVTLQSNWQQISQLLKCYPSIEELDLSTSSQLGALPEDLSFLSRIKRITFLKQPAADLARIEQNFPDLFALNVIQKEMLLADSKSTKKKKWQDTKADLQLDSNTEQEEAGFERQVFDNIKPENYRRSCYQDIAISENAVSLKKSASTLKPCSLAKASMDAETYTGWIELEENDWTVLPSLTMKDSLISLQSNPAVDLEIAFNDLEKLYYIKPKQTLMNLPILISYTIEAEFREQRQAFGGRLKQAIHDQIAELNFTREGVLEKNAAFQAFSTRTVEEKLNAFMSYFNQFEAKSLTMPYRGHALLNAIIHQKAGACRHRTIAFMALAKAFNLPVRAICNDIHAYVEVKLHDTWQRADLGGTDPHKLHTIPLPKKPELVEISPENPFQSWNTVPIAAKSMQDYAKTLGSLADALDKGKKNALTILNPAQISAFSYEMLKNKKGGCFYLSDLNNIKDKQTVIEKGSLKQQDSALKKFLKTAKSGDVLLVNWSDYQAEHVGYNSMMDTKRKILGMEIPEGVIVIGMLSHGQTMGEDFYSRFRMVSDCPASLSLERVLPLPEKPVESEKPRSEICFYDDSWRSSLLGKISAIGGYYALSASYLLDAIAAGEESIVLRNAPWEALDFQLFISELLAKGEIEVNGQRYKIPENFRILRDDSPYPLETANYRVEAYTRDTALEDTTVLNFMTFNSLFQRIQSEEGKLNTLPGLLAAHKDRTLRLFVTQSLTDLQWARIFNEAKIYNTEVHLVLAAGVRLASHPQILSTETIVPPKVGLIETECPDFVSASLPEDTLIIPINEKTTYADLTGVQNITRSGTAILGDYKPGILLEALKAGKAVALKGSLSPILAEELSPLFLQYLPTNGNREENLPGLLTIITDKNPGLAFVTAEKRTVQESEIWFKLQRSYPDKADLLKNVCLAFCKSSNAPPFQYTALVTMLEHMTHQPKSNPLKQILRTRADYASLKTVAEKAWKEAQTTVKDKTQKPLLIKRYNKLKSRLEHSWYVFVAGSSGVGKSTTINQAVRQLGFEAVTSTGSLKEKLKAWLVPGAKRSLFIDEANLYEAGEFDILEGLYSKPAKLLIDGVYYEVPAENRLFFAGNFGHFLGREESRFISRHGNVITFKEFDDDFLRDNIMQPICDSLKISEEEAERITSLFIRVYHQVNKANPEKHPLTARNLQMMVMRYANTGNAYLALYDEVTGVLNKKSAKDLAIWIKQEYNQDVSQLKRSAKKREVKSEPQSFLITKKRVNPVRILQNLMKIRDAKINNPEALASAGSNGLILEGKPGIGKSFLALEYLRSENYVNGAEISRKEAEEQGLALHKRYYHIQGGTLDEVKTTLIQAFHEGAWVIIDEMNTLPLEHLLNALLSGTTPEGLPAKAPGFFVTGTQNPIHFGNRSAYSEAFLNRFQKLDLKDFGKEDLQVITSSLLEDSKEVVKLVDYFLQAEAYAKAQRKLSPTPRDLFAKAEETALRRKR